MSDRLYSTVCNVRGKRQLGNVAERLRDIANEIDNRLLHENNLLDLIDFVSQRVAWTAGNNSANISSALSAYRDEQESLALEKEEVEKPVISYLEPRVEE